MHQTTIYLDQESSEMLEKYFKGDLFSSSSALLRCITKWFDSGCPGRCYGHDLAQCERVRYRVGIPEEIYTKIPSGINLSFTIREYLKHNFL